MAERLLSSGELANALGVSRGAVIKWTNQGLIHPVVTTPGGHHRWRLQDVQNELNALRKHDED